MIGWFQKLETSEKIWFVVFVILISFMSMTFVIENINEFKTDNLLGMIEVDLNEFQQEQNKFYQAVGEKRFIDSFNSIEKQEEIWNEIKSQSPNLIQEEEAKMTKKLFELNEEIKAEYRQLYLKMK